jgi:hypothetical protein
MADAADGLDEPRTIMARLVNTPPKPHKAAHGEGEAQG